LRCSFSLPLHHALPIYAAVEAADSASISTPVTPVVFTSVSTRNTPASVSASKSTVILPSGIGWHNGMVSQVFFAAIMPANRATGNASPFSSPASIINFTTSERVCTRDDTREDLDVVFFSVKSTICAEPSARTWLSFCSIDPFRPQNRGSRLTINLHSSLRSQHSVYLGLYG